MRLAGVMTHFTDAGCDAASTLREHALFRTTLDRIGGLPRGCRVHAAATAAAAQSPAFHHDLVRIGLGWAGWVPGTVPPGSHAAAMAGALRPAVTWTSSVSHVHRLERGHRVGYGGRWLAAKATCIGLVPVGYADGIPPAAGGTPEAPGATVLVESAGGWTIRAPIIGAVSMDQIAVDLGPDGEHHGLGAAVTVVGGANGSGAGLPEFAAACGVTPHQVLVGIGPKVQRTYRNGSVGVTERSLAAAV